MSIPHRLAKTTNNRCVATDKNSDDLVSRRMNATDDDPEATAQFDAFPRESTPEKPSMLSDEEWALLSDGPGKKSPETAGTSEVASKDGTEATKDATDTQKLAKTRETSVKRQHSSARPADREEPTRVMPAAVPAGSSSAATTTAAPSTAAATTSAPQPGLYHRFGFLDFIATAIIVASMPFMLVALAIKIASSGMFLRFEYFINPIFPNDKYGFHSEDRLHYASYVANYLFNGDSSRYLADVVFPDGKPVFTDGEIAHMSDVKGLVTLLFFIAIVGMILSLISAVYLGRKYGPGLHHAMRWSGIVTLTFFAILTVVALLGWDQFFTGFHDMFFASGTWQFYLDDSLIRLFPPQFWIDAGVFVAAFVVLISILLIAISRIGHKKRKLAREAAKQA